MLFDMHVTYDHGDAYIYFEDSPRRPKGMGSSYVVEHDEAAASEIILDFDEKGVLLGIEVLGARKGLPADLLKNARRGSY